MNPEKHFTRAVAALPAPIRERLSRDTPLDWSALEDPATGEALADAARAHDRLPAAVEALVDRLVRDVGIVPANLAAGVERQGPAEEWRHEVAIEADGECYRLRDRRGGKTHVGVRPEAVAGYAILALELAAAVHEAAERWIEAGERRHADAGGGANLLAQCAIGMCAQLGSRPDPGAEHRTTAGLAKVLERAWNNQSLKMRAALSASREGPLANAVALGMYKNKANMERRVLRLKELGYPVEWKANGRKDSYKILEARVAGGTEALGAAWASRFPGHTLRNADCR